MSHDLWVITNLFRGKIDKSVQWITRQSRRIIFALLCNIQAKDSSILELRYSSPHCTVEPWWRWLSYRLDVIIATYVTVLSFAFIPLSKSQRFSELFGFSAGSVGLVLSTAQHMLGLFQWGIRQLSETENQLTSVERLLEYAKLEPEPSLGQGFLDRPGWPV